MVTVLLLSAFLGADPASPATGISVAGRHPVAAVPLDGGRRLVVACERSGSLATVDAVTGTIVEHGVVGERLVDLAGPTPGGQLLALDAARRELLVIVPAATPNSAAPWQVRGRLALPTEPSTVVLDTTGQHAYVTSRWSRQWQSIGLAELLTGPRRGAAEEHVSPPLELPFAPLLQCVLPDGDVMVADAFGGHLARIRPQPPQVVAWTELPIHNIRALQLSPDRQSLVFTHQVLDQRRTITQADLLAGRLLRNGVSRLPLSTLREKSGAWESQRQFQPLDEPPGGSHDEPVREPQRPSSAPDGGAPNGGAPDGGAPRSVASQDVVRSGQGAGDPAGLAWWENTLLVALSGRGQVVEFDGRTGATQRRDVGMRPTAVVALPAAEVVAVLNTLDDSLTLLDPRGRQVPRRVSLGAPPLDSPQARGERLFFDARLSAGGFLSCHSCHTDGHTHGLLADTLGDDTQGTPKRTLTLLGTALTYRWAWIGTQPSLHDQVKKSIEQTMHGEGGTFQAVSDLVAYLHTLPPPPPLTLPRPEQPSDTALRERGRQVFAAHGCGDCHIPPLVYSSHESYDVGLTDERGVRKFNPPSLRGVGQLYRLLHDNRATSLEAVFRDHHHPSGLTLDDDELTALVRFLRSL